MSNQTYDQKNKEDFEANTRALNSALLKIKSNKKLKATVAQLSEITGVHRNTITNRAWPIQALKQIKKDRKNEEELCEKKTAQNTKDIKKLLEDKLNQTQNEVVYWFNEYKDMKRYFDHSHQQLKKMRKSRDHYRMLYETERESLFNAELEIEKLKELIKSSSAQLRH